MTNVKVMFHQKEYVGIGPVMLAFLFDQGQLIGMKAVRLKDFIRWDEFLMEVLADPNLQDFQNRLLAVLSDYISGANSHLLDSVDPELLSLNSKDSKTEQIVKTFDYLEQMSLSDATWESSIWLTFWELALEINRLKNLNLRKKTEGWRMTLPIFGEADQEACGELATILEQGFCFMVQIPRIQTKEG